MTLLLLLILGWRRSSVYERMSIRIRIIELRTYEHTLGRFRKEMRGMESTYSAHGYNLGVAEHYLGVQSIVAGHFEHIR